MIRQYTSNTTYKLRHRSHTYFEITANSEIHTNKPKKPAVCTSDKIKADLAEAKVITFAEAELR